MEKAKRVKEVSEEEKNDIKKKLLLELFDKQGVRKALHNGKWYFSIVDIMGVFLFEKDHKKVKNYWNVLKSKGRKQTFDDHNERLPEHFQSVTHKKPANPSEGKPKSRRKRDFSVRKPHFLMGNQLKLDCYPVAMKASDGKFYKTEAIPASSFLLLLKTLSAVKGERMRLWLQRGVRLAQLRESGKPTCRSNF